jgi:hypothetical protein
MKIPPAFIDGARVLEWTPIDKRHQATGRTSHVVDGRRVGPATALAICTYDRDRGFYLFGCDSDWNMVTDTLHHTLKEAKEQTRRSHL